MRALLVGVLLCGALPARAAEPVPLSPIHLDGEEDLAKLAASNPAHYSRAKRLIAAANVLCRPGHLKLENADGRDISCALLLFTSNPPKRQLSFTLDGTPYVALVTITADPPKPMHAGPHGPHD